MNKKNPDYHYSKKEIETIVSLSNKENFEEDLLWLKQLISKDIMNANISELNKQWNFDKIIKIIELIKTKYPDMTQKLKQFKIIDKDWNVKEKSWFKWIIVLQLVLSILGYKWVWNTELSVDGSFWVNTMFALLNFQKNNITYKSIENSKSDWIVGTKTLESIISTLKPVEKISEDDNQKIAEDKIGKISENKPENKPDEKPEDKWTNRKVIKDDLLLK